MTDLELEQLIEKAGRDKVFALVRENGWSGPMVPRMVWIVAAQQVLKETA